jgi:hypothetical protein
MARCPQSAVSALKEKEILSGLRVERAEQGQPNEFAKLSEQELDALIVAEYERLRVLPARSDNVVPMR